MSKSTAQLKKQCIKLVENILYAKRNENWRAEEKAYQKFLEFCEKNNINHLTAYEGAVKELNQSVSAIMNGIV